MIAFFYLSTHSFREPVRAHTGSAAQPPLHSLDGLVWSGLERDRSPPPGNELVSGHLALASVDCRVDL